MTPWALTLPFFVLWSKVRRGGPVRGQAIWQVDGAKPMIWRFIMLSYVHHHNIPGARNIVFTALDNIEVLKVSQTKTNHTARVNPLSVPMPTWALRKPLSFLQYQITGIDTEDTYEGAKRI
jgi:hypothetical protein